MEKIIIIWGGPSGHTAAIYAAQASLKPLMFEWFMAAWVPAGGQLMTTTVIENFPWFPGGVWGPELMMKMKQQSKALWTRIETKTVDRVDLSSRPFKVFVWKDVFETQSLVISTWATAKRMWLPWEMDYWNKGISACAVCDWGLPIFRNQTLIVIWWWDTAMEEASHLTHFSDKVKILVRRDELRASQVMQDKVLNNPKIEVLWNTEAKEFYWDGKLLSWIKAFNNKTNESFNIEAKGLFYAIGHTPNTAFLDWQVELENTWYIKTKSWSTQTNIPWVFAAWDVQDSTFRQAITSAGSWCMACMEAGWFLENSVD